MTGAAGREGFSYGARARAGLWPYRVDLRNERLWRGPEALVLRPKSFAVRRYLLVHPDRLVSKEELLEAVWPTLAVTEAGLTMCISEIRKTLRDDPQAPQFIETLHRRGYRFIGQLATMPATPHQAVSPQPMGPDTSTLNSQSSILSPAALIRREIEFRRLHAWFEAARGGVRQVGFVTGEAGLGKTTLVDTFLQDLASAGGVRLARGQCIEHYGAGEAYLPVLAALGDLCRGPGGAQMLTLLGQRAPTWLAQMPALLSAADLEAIQRRVLGATQERMLRELAEALEALTANTALVLVLEDLHWGDYATVDLLSWLARRREPARLLLLGTYRPVEVILRAHPLGTVKHDLEMHGQCAELALELLTEAEVGQYLVARCGVPQPPPLWVTLLYQRTDGLPLFLVTLVDYLEAQGALAPGAGAADTTAQLAALDARRAEAAGRGQCRRSGMVSRGRTAISAIAPIPCGSTGWKPACVTSLDNDPHAGREKETHDPVHLSMRRSEC